MPNHHHGRYEQVGLDDAVDEPGGCILAHIMGLGKTLTTIAFLHTYLSMPAVDPGMPRRILVVVPSNVLYNFYAEFRRWLPSSESQDNKSKSSLTRKKVGGTASHDKWMGGGHKPSDMIPEY